MLTAQHTPNLTGALLVGDTEDFEELYEALHLIVGTEDTVKNHYDVRIRVLGLCYDIRHARLGNRNAFFKSHGFNEEQLEYLALESSTNDNLYLSFETLWPELLFIVVSLEDFIPQYQKRMKTHNWDLAILTVRKFQGTIIHLLEQSISARQFSTFKKLMQTEKPLYKSYLTQYIDLLNDVWLQMDKPAREESFYMIIKKLALPNEEYNEMKKDIQKIAKQHNVPASEIELNVDFPEFIEW